MRMLHHTWLLLILGILLITPYSLSADTGIVTAGSGLNIREKPDSKSKIVVTAPFKSRIDVEEVTKIKETIKGEPGVWLKVSFYDFMRDKENTGYAFSAYIFRKEGAEFPQIREDFLAKKFSIEVRREGSNDLHWNFSLKLKNGKSVILFQNDGDEQKGADDYVICDYFPEAGFVGFNHNSPDYWLVDHQSGRIQTLGYGLPSFNQNGSAYFDWSAGGMFGSHFVIYDLTARIPTQTFALEESDLQRWDMFRPVWKDSSTVEISYVMGGKERSLRIKHTAKGWRKEPEAP